MGHLKSKGFAYSASFAFSLHHLQKLQCPLDKVFVLTALVEPLSAETGGAVAENESLEAFIELQHVQVKVQRSVFHLKPIIQKPSIYVTVKERKSLCLRNCELKSTVMSVCFFFPSVASSETREKQHKVHFSTVARKQLFA